MPGPRYEQQSEFFGDPEKLLSGLGLSIEGQQKQAYNTWHAENADRSLAEDLALRTRAQGEVEAQNRWQQLRDRWAEQHQQTTDDRGWREKVVQNYVGRIKTQQELIATQIESMKASRARAQARGVSADTTALKANAEAASDLYTAMDAIDRLMGQQKDRGGKSPAEWTKLYNDWDGRIKNKTLNGQPTASYLREFVKKDKAGRDYDMAWVRQGVQTATQTLKDNEVGKLDETQFAAYINELVAKAPQPQQSVLDQIMFGKLGPLAGLDQKAQEGAQKRNALPPLPGSPSVNRPSTPPQVPPPSSTFLHPPPPRVRVGTRRWIRRL